MRCCLVITSLLMPRVAMVIIRLLTVWFDAAYKSLVWPVLGFLFMPYTTLAYMAAMLKNNGSLSGGWLILVIVAVVVDVTHLGGGGSAARKRRR